MALQGYLVEVKAQSSAVTMTDEATSTSDNTTYQITSTSKQIIDLNTAIIVKDGGTTTTEKYTIDHINGSITFTESDTRTITISGKYVSPTTVATAKDINLSVNADVLDNTTFLSTFRTYQGGLVSGSVTLGRFHVSDDLFIDCLLDGEYKVIEFWVDSTHSIKCYGLINSNGIESPVSGLVDESVDFTITNRIGVN